jgi:hypothetical protein
MKDWVSIAKGHGLDLSARELDRIAQPLAALDETFQPLVAHLTPDTEPAFEFRMEDDE